MIEEDETEESSKPASEKSDTMAETNKASEVKSPIDGAKKTERAAETPTKLADLPADVRTRLQRFENLQAKYKGRTMVGVCCMTWN